MFQVVSGCGTGPGKCLPKVQLYHIGHSSQTLVSELHRHPSNRFHVMQETKKGRGQGSKGTGHLSRQSAIKGIRQGAKESRCS